MLREVTFCDESSKHPLSEQSGVAIRNVLRAILVRYMWSDISPQSARMEQSFSADGGRSWEVNWICELTR